MTEESITHEKKEMLEKAELLLKHDLEEAKIKGLKLLLEEKKQARDKYNFKMAYIEEKIDLVLKETIISNITTDRF